MATSLSMAPEQLNTRRSSAAHRQAFAPALLYAKDGKYLFQREAHVIRVLNTKNGQVLHECIRSEQPALPTTTGTVSGDDAAASAAEQDSDSHRSSALERVDVTALALHPYNALQLIASYADGKIIVWDFIEEKMLQEFDAKAPILWMGASVASPLMLVLVISGGSAIDKTPPPPQNTTTATTGSSPAKQQQKKDKTEDATTSLATPVDTGVTRWSVVEFNMKKKRRGRTLLEQTKVPFVAAALQSYLSYAPPTSSNNNNNSDSATTTTNDEDYFHGDYIVIVASARVFTLKVVRDQDGGAGMGRAVAVQKLSHLRDVTCLALHPHDAMEFAIGDSLGQIFRFLKGAASTAKMHWHSHAVGCLSYSHDGNSLLSGGEENVLVSWQLESGRRSYLPRRSAPLTCIATRVDTYGSGYAVTLRDNVLFQYNPITKEEEWQSIGLARSGEQASAALPWQELVFDPLTHAVPMNGVSSAGVLQFYEPYKDRVLFSVTLTERNQVTRTEDEEMPQILAEKIAFSPNGHELVTLHRPTQGEATTTTTTGEEQALRFWKRRENGSFYVHTAIDAPHGVSAVTSLAFCPSSYSHYSSDGIVVTGDAQGEFKVWKKTTVVTAASSTASSVPGQPQASSSNAQTVVNEVSTTVWHCQSVVKFRDTAITSIQFARDGSLLAVAYGHLLTLWDLSTMALRGVLASADGSAVQQVIFPGATSPYVVVKTCAQIQVWNLLSMSLWWRYIVPAKSSFLVAKENDFLVAIKIPSENEYVLLSFDPETPVPTSIQRVPFAQENEEIWTLAVHPKNGDVLLLDQESNLWRVGDQRLDKKALRTQDGAGEEEEMTPLAAMFKQARSEFQSKRQEALAREKQYLSVSANAAASGASPDSTAALFDAPAHVLPSMTSLYRSFMDKMLPKANALTGNGAAGDEDELLGGKKGRKKNNKKRKKASASFGDHGEQDSTSNGAAAATTSEQDQAKQKRVKAMIEKELALPKQTYSTLLDAFRKNKKTTKSSANV